MLKEKKFNFNIIMNQTADLIGFSQLFLFYNTFFSIFFLKFLLFFVFRNFKNLIFF